MVNDKQDNWDQVTDDILFAYRTSVQATTKYTPFSLMFGREARLPIQVELKNECVDENPQVMDRRLEELKIVRETYNSASENITKAQESQKKYYDKKHGASKSVSNSKYSS